MISKSCCIGTLFLALVVLGLSTAATAQTVKLYPSTLRITKLKSNTATAVYKNASGTHSNATFSFSSTSPGVATVNNDKVWYNESTGAAVFSPNLASIKALSAGTTTITATTGSLTTNALTVIVDDPAASPSAVIHGDNDATGSITARVGEPIEVNGDSSVGVNAVEWNWGDGDKTMDNLSGTHSYLVAGSYTLSLKITNSSGTVSTANVSVTIQNFPAATTTFTVTTIAQLISAYNQCNGGEHIVIPAGTTLSGTVELPARTFSDYVTIRSGGTMPDIRDRISPSSNQLVIIRSTAVNNPSLKIHNSVSKVRFVGINFLPFEQTTSDHFSLIEVGDYEQTSVSTNPSKIIFQHIVMNPPTSTAVRHGMMNDGYKVAIISSWLGDIYTRCVPGEGCQTDSNGVYSLNGRGAHVYNNTFIEASTEGILYGGAAVTIDGHVPTNIEMRRCHFFKRTAWKPNPTPLFNVKNMLEFKIGRRAYLEGNVLENHWLGADAGQPNGININALAEPESPWTLNEDITLENNKVVQMPSGVLVSSVFYSNDESLNYDPRKSQNIRFKNMVFDKFDSATAERFVIVNGAEHVLFDHVTQIDAGLETNKFMHLVTPNNYGLQVTNSIIGMGTDYEIFYDGGFFGKCALNRGTGGANFSNPCNQDGNWTFSNNIMVRYNSNSLSFPPAGNCDTAVGYSAVGFVNLAGGDYRLTGSGPCYPGQTNIGADIPTLNTRTQCTVSGVGTNCSGTPPTQAPYSGTAPVIPFVIEAENYDVGGEGVGYHDVTSGNSGGVYRSDDVDIQARPNFASNGYEVANASAGEWLEYTVNVPQARKFDIGIRYASAFDNGKIRIEDCGSNPNNNSCTDITGLLTTTKTSTNGTWDTFRTVTARNVQLSAGNHTLRLVMVTNSPDGCGCVVADFDSLIFRRTAFDFDGDGWADVSVFRPSDGTWYLNQSRSGFAAMAFGLNGDIIAPGDFDGDGRTDVAVFRPSSGNWYIYNSLTGSVTYATFGSNGDVPVQADYDGDGKADIAVWRPSDGTWYRLNSSNGAFVAYAFGSNGDRPAVGDYDGDGKSDYAVFRPSDTYWYIQRSTAGYTGVPFGLASDKITPADYDGDGKTDIAVFRPSNGTWYRTNSSNGQFVGQAFGTSGDTPAPADLDGDGKDDLVVFRPSNGDWYYTRSLLGYSGEHFGLGTDTPVPSTYVR